MEKNRGYETWKPLDKTKDRVATPADDLAKDEKADKRKSFYNEKWHNRNQRQIYKFI